MNLSSNKPSPNSSFNINPQENSHLNTPTKPTPDSENIQNDSLLKPSTTPIPLNLTTNNKNMKVTDKKPKFPKIESQSLVSNPQIPEATIDLFTESKDSEHQIIQTGELKVTDSKEESPSDSDEDIHMITRDAFFEYSAFTRDKKSRLELEKSFDFETLLKKKRQKYEFTKSANKNQQQVSEKIDNNLKKNIGGVASSRQLTDIANLLDTQNAKLKSKTNSSDLIVSLLNMISPPSKQDIEITPQPKQFDLSSFLQDPNMPFQIPCEQQTTNDNLDHIPDKPKTKIFDIPQPATWKALDGTKLTPDMLIAMKSATEKDLIQDTIPGIIQIQTTVNSNYALPLFLLSKNGSGKSHGVKYTQTQDSLYKKLCGIRISNLTTKDHKDYKRLLALKKHTNVQKQQFQTLKSKFGYEQSEFHKKMLDILLDTKPTGNLDNHILSNKIVLENIQKYSKSILEKYPHKYNKISMVTTHSLPTDPLFNLQYIKTCCQKGYCNNFQYKNINKRLATVNTLKKLEEIDYCHGVMISTEIESKEQATLNSADIVISEDALVSLFTLSDSLDEDVLVPMVGKKTESGKTTVYIDDPVRQLSYISNQSNLDTIALKRIAGEMLLGNKKLDFENGDNLSDTKNSNYTLWKFGDLTILIHYTVNGYLEKDSNSTCTIVPIVENMLGYGQQTLTNAQKLQAYMHAYIRGQSKLAYCHYTPGKQHYEMVHIGICDPNQLFLVPDNNIHNESVTRNPIKYTGSNFKQLYKLLVHIKSCTANQLPEENYLLYHKSNEFSCSLYKSLDQNHINPSHNNSIHIGSSDSLDLNLELGYVNEPPENIKVQHGLKYTPFIWPYSPDRVPYTFPPSDEF
ncbi:hypothetical protein BB558_004724 [Smittium angustum]|uniref:Little elongation complex subunit 2 C-terminal domain-containing protein n=1 Tax=Smittium angustum TaxID=133377 RepID=A0A2U1J2N6_SMIAN|nr:hypothetical protein BB558_004724 [Smittium angustum]